MRVQVGCSVKDLFCEQLGLNPEYFEERVQTIFMDGNPVDDAASTTVRADSVIAISGAMPGLVGAVMRKGGFYAPLRKEISHREANQSETRREGDVFLKVFNILLKDLGPVFLEKGIRIMGTDLEYFIQKQLADFWTGFRSAQKDGKDINQKELMAAEWPNGLVFLQVLPLHL